MSFIKTSSSSPQHHTPHNPLERGWFQTNAKAVLYIYGPRPIFDQAIRPHTYHVDENLSLNMTNAVEQLTRTGQRTQISALLGSNSALTAAVPAQMGQYLKTGVFSDRWTFTLVITDDGQAGHGDVLTMNYPGSTKRIKFSGYFVDEPANPLCQGAEPTLNPLATMIFTDRDIANQSIGYGAHQMTSGIVGVASDMIIPPQDMIGISGTNDLVIQTPDKIFEGSDMVAEPGLDVMPDNAYLASANAPPIVSTSQLDPIHCFRTLTNALATGYETLRVRSGDSHAGFDGLICPEDTLNSSILQNLRVESNFSTARKNNIDVTRPHRLGDILARFSPTVVPLQERGSQYYTPFDQMDSSQLGMRINQVSAMITNGVLPALAQQGFTRLEFKYDSFIDKLGTVNYTGIGPELSSYDTIFPMTADQVMAKWRSIIRHLTDTTFQAVKSLHGDFNFIGSFAIGHYSTCTVNLYQHQASAFQNTVPYEVPTILGGINTNSLATSNVMMDNIGNIGVFARTVTGMDSSAYAEQYAPVGSYQSKIEGIFNTPPAHNFITSTRGSHGAPSATSGNIGVDRLTAYSPERKFIR